jgi:hypothetical protein
MKIREIAKQSPLAEGAKEIFTKKVVPGIGFADAGIRAAQGDWVGTGIGTVAGGLGLIPTPMSQGASIGLDALNQLRDYAKEKGGWVNLGKEYYDSIKNQEYDPTFLPEGFEELDRLEQAGKLDEAGLRDILFNPKKYGSMAMDWFRNLRKGAPDAPPRVEPPAAPKAEPPAAPKAEPPAAPKDKGPLDLEKEFQKREAERLAAAEKAAAEKAAADAAAADAAAAEKSAADAAATSKGGKLDKKWHENQKQWLDRVEREGGPAAMDKLQKRLNLEKSLKDAELDTWAGATKDVLGKAALKGLGTTVRWGVPAGAAYGAYEYGPSAAQKGIEWWREGPEKKILNLAPKGDLLSDKIDGKPADTPAPSGNDTNDKPKSDLPSDRIESNEDKLTKKYKQFLNDDKKPQYTKDQYVELAAKYAKQYDVPVAMVLHAMRKETGAYDANTAATILGPKTPYGQAVGVMQLMPMFFPKLKPEDFTNPEKNIEAGTKFLAKLHQQYKDPLKALAAYNAGPANKLFLRYLETGNPKDLPLQTQQYLYGDPKRKGNVAYTDDVKTQLAAYNPKSKMVDLGTEVLSTVSGSGNAQAAPAATKNLTQVAYPRHGTPIDKERQDYENSKLIPQDGRVQKQLNDLSSDFKYALNQALRDYPGTLRVTGGTRTQEDQTRLFRAWTADQKILKDHGGNAAEARKHGYRGLKVASQELASHLGYAIDADEGDMNKFYKWLKKNDPGGAKYGLETGHHFNDEIHLQLKDWDSVDKRRRELNKTLPKNKQLANAAEYDRYLEQQQLAARDEARRAERQIDPGLGGASDAQAATKDGDDKSLAQKLKDRLAALKFPSVQSDIPAGSGSDYQTQGDATPKKAEKPAEKDQKSKPAGSKVTVTDTQGRSTTYTKNEKGEWVSPNGQMLPMPGQDIDKKGAERPAEKPADKPRSQQSASGTIDRGSDAPKLSPQKSKADSTLDKPAPGVSTTTAPPKSEPPVKADADAKAKADADAAKAAKAAKDKADADAARAAKDKADTNAGLGLQGSDKGKSKTGPAKTVAEPKADAPPADASSKEKTNVRQEFEKAFAAARAQQIKDTGKGSGGIFTFKNPVTGKEGVFTTDYADEVKSKAKSSKAGVDDAVTQIIQGKKVVPSTDSNIDFDPISKRQKSDKPSDAKADIDAKVDARLSKELDQKLPPDYTVDIDPEALKVPAAPAPAVKSDLKTDKPANVLRSTDGTPVISGTGDPLGTGTSDQRDIERAKAELQKKIDDEKAKRDLEKISPDLSKQEPESFVDKWDRVIDTLTGNRRPPADRETIRVPESVNTELKDILWLAGRTKK